MPKMVMLALLFFPFAMTKVQDLCVRSKDPQPSALASFHSFHVPIRTPVGQSLPNFEPLREHPQIPSTSKQTV